MLNKSTISPLFIYGTRHGTLYNLTPTNQPKHIPAIQLSYGDFHDYIETIKNLPSNLSFKKYLGFQNSTLTYLTPYNFQQLGCINGCHHKDKVKIKTNQGYHQVTPQQYDQLIDTIKPDYFVGLTQYPSLQKDYTTQSNKRHKRAILKTKTYLQTSPYTKTQQQNTNYQGPIRLAAIHGGKNLSLILRSLQQVLDHAIDGIVVCNMYEEQTEKQRQDIFNTIKQRLQQQYKRDKSYFQNKKLKLCLSGQGKLQNILHALKFGFQLFQINYPFLMAQKYLALIKNKQTGIYQPKNPTRTQSLKPLEQDCKCLACINHSQSYIAYLIQCFQMTGKVLLSIHNLHVYENWLSNYQTI